MLQSQEGRFVLLMSDPGIVVSVAGKQNEDDNKMMATTKTVNKIIRHAEFPDSFNGFL